ncbi:hypothetical protein MP228_009160 [Amoeboaphelidium protococcarum]|nr:hypothetical protein MP228_009160 [Amoeboaphelidium protococcarum]
MTIADTTTKFSVPKKANYTVYPAPYAFEVPGFRNFNGLAFWGLNLLTPLALVQLLQTPYWSYPLFLLLTIVPTWVGYVYVDAYLKVWAHDQQVKAAGLKLTDYVKLTDAKLADKYQGSSKIPMETFFEAYFDEKAEIRGDMLDLLEHRHDWASFHFTAGHVKFLAEHLLPEATFHTRSQDKNQVCEHYDRGNDFYEAFLGPMMIYTSGIITDVNERESLEQLQENKMKLVCEKIGLKRGEKMLDIGCGWGTLLSFAAQKYGANPTGVTISKEQTEFGLNRAQEWGVSDKVNILNRDYRDIPRPMAAGGQKYNKITCLEMAEHVGIRKFNTFLRQVDELLEDDGIFYLQIAGLRRPWQYEDLVWGLFMNKYVFPGADASCPLAWVVSQLEYAGFEVQSVDTVGVHYSATLERWYQNWMKPENKSMITAKYGERAWREWEFFLAWSTIISRQGSATCYQLVCHKNTNKFDRASFLRGYGQQRLIVPAAQQQQ